MSERRALFVAALIGLLVWFSWASRCAAEVERYAVVVGSNRGLADEPLLRFANTDAKRVYDVLRDLGGFSPVNTVLLEDASADELRSTLISVNDRVRSALTVPGREVMLFVYYSGHGDVESLHLDGVRFPVSELYQLVRGSAAQFRLLVLDACQSGALTRRKGGRVTAPFPLPAEPTLPGEGMALLTASTAHEDSQESDQLGASFFTHAFVSGLLGAADLDRDGAVVLEEAYRYAYDATLRATSRTQYGLQHPTFAYDLRGQGQLVLTRPALRERDRGLLQLPSGASYLVMHGAAEGRVVAEIGEHDRVRTLSLAPGTYSLLGRASAHLLQGSVRVLGASLTQVDPETLTKLEYARLVRKGGSPIHRAHALELGARVHTPLVNEERLCSGGYLGYRLAQERYTLAARAGACASGFENSLVRARVLEAELGLRVERVWDVARRLSLALGAGSSLTLFRQSFETRGLAPARTSLAGAGELFAAAALELGSALYLQLDVGVVLYVLPVTDGEGRSVWQASPAPRASFGFGRQF